MSTPDDPTTLKPPAESSETKPGPIYSQRQKTGLRKSGEAVTSLGTGAASITALNGVAAKFLDEEAGRGDLALSATVFVIGVLLVGLGVYLHMEAER